MRSVPDFSMFLKSTTILILWKIFLLPNLWCREWPNAISWNRNGIHRLVFDKIRSQWPDKLEVHGIHNGKIIKTNKAKSVHEHAAQPQFEPFLSRFWYTEVNTTILSVPFYLEMYFICTCISFLIRKIQPNLEIGILSCLCSTRYNMFIPSKNL